jgi:hypothetical protein
MSNIDTLTLGKLLQISFSNGVRNQLSQNFRDFEEVKAERIGNPNGREHRFMLQTSMGPAAIQYLSPTGGSFPASHKASVSEHTAIFKELAATVEIEWNLWKRAQMSPAKYAEPLALEFQSKSIAMKRRLAADLHGDGLGVVGQLASASASVTGSDVRFQLATTDSARGHVGFFEFGDILVLRDADGTATALDTNLATEPAYWKVISRDRKNDRVVLRGLDSSFAEVSISSISVQAAAGAVFYRYAQPSIPDLTGAIADYGSATEVMPGLESLVAADGRVVHGVTMSGATAGTQIDCGGSGIDVSFLEEGLSTVKVNVGQGVYSWSKFCMAPEARSALINAAETDRRFQAVQDAQRGFSKFVYVHEQDSVEMYSSEYCPKKRARALPKGKAAEGRVLELHMSDLSLVQVDGNKLFLKPASGGGFSRNVQQFLEGYGTLLCKHPASVLTLRNFAVS